MADYRFGDETPPPQRSDRVTGSDIGGWYFTTREGAPVGPYSTESEARTALSDFLEFIQLADLDTLAALTSSLTTLTAAGNVERTADLSPEDGPNPTDEVAARRSDDAQ